MESNQCHWLVVVGATLSLHMYWVFTMWEALAGTQCVWDHDQSQLQTIEAADLVFPIPLILWLFSEEGSLFWEIVQKGQEAKTKLYSHWIWAPRRISVFLQSWLMQGDVETSCSRKGSLD